VSMRLPRAAVAGVPDGMRIVSVERMSRTFTKYHLDDGRALHRLKMEEPHPLTRSRSCSTICDGAVSRDARILLALVTAVTSRSLASFACQMPEGAKGVLSITMESETGIRSGILSLDRFEGQRRIVMMASEVGLKGRIQKGAG
jgi:hypothetical protein